MVVAFPDDVADRLRSAAKARGVTADELAVELVADHLPLLADSPGRRRLALAGVGASGTGLTHRIDETLAEGFGRD